SFKQVNAASFPGARYVTEPSRTSPRRLGCLSIVVQAAGKSGRGGASPEWSSVPPTRWQHHLPRHEEVSDAAAKSAAELCECPKGDVLICNLSRAGGAGDCSAKDQRVTYGQVSMSRGFGRLNTARAVISRALRRDRDNWCSALPARGSVRDASTSSC